MGDYVNPNEGQDDGLIQDHYGGRGVGDWTDAEWHVGRRIIRRVLQLTP